MLALTIAPIAAPQVADAAPALPNATGSTGDSITREFNACGWYVDCVSGSWSTGDSASLSSHYLLIRAVSSEINGRSVNAARSGAEVIDLDGQMNAVIASGAQYVKRHADVAVHGWRGVGLSCLRGKVHDRVDVREHVPRAPSSVATSATTTSSALGAWGRTRSTPRTTWPASARPGISVRPIRPAAPVNATRTRPHRHTAGQIRSSEQSPTVRYLPRNHASSCADAIGHSTRTAWRGRGSSDRRSCGAARDSEEGLRDVEEVELWRV